jgi:FixJ family two-component response regulator
MTSSVVHVVDDDEMARKGTARLLEAAGFDVRTVCQRGRFPDRR